MSDLCLCPEFDGFYLDATGAQLCTSCDGRTFVSDPDGPANDSGAEEPDEK